MTTKPESDARRAIRGLRTWSLALLMVGTCGLSFGGEGERPGSGRASILGRMHPAGGWRPDGGGLMHWWNSRCFPRCGGPDDYCRKPPPNVCLPSYPPFYNWGPPGPDSPPPSVSATVHGKGRTSHAEGSKGMPWFSAVAQE